MLLEGLQRHVAGLHPQDDLKTRQRVQHLRLLCVVPWTLVCVTVRVV